MIGTFASVLVFTMLKEAFEDFQRLKSDRELNNRKTQVFDEKTSKLNTVHWSQVKVG